ncbi:MAG TPA: hypothetical protein VMH39_05045, partial [Gemmatimonadaceae bacterium]|nr:hypothetical protein [Gemmatimonadaceae bacterium]
AAAIAYIDEIQGNLAPAVAGLRRAVLLDPRNAHTWCQLAIAYSTGGQYGPARQSLMTALAVDPRTAEAYAILSQVELMATGDAARALSVLDSAPADLESNALLIEGRVEALLVRHDFAGATRYALGLEPGDGLSALQALETKGGTLWLGGNRTGAAPFLSQAIDTLKEQVLTTTVPIQAYAELALSAARLGRLEDVQAYAKRVNAIAAAGPVPFDYEINPWLTLASAYAAIGDGSDAVAALEKACPSACGLMLSGPTLRRDPTWDPIRTDPGFQALLATYENGRG